MLFVSISIFSFRSTVALFAVIVLVTLIAILSVFTNLFEKQTDNVGNQIDGLDDEDGDEVINMFDKCPCIVGEREYDGCTSQTALDKAKTEPKPKSC